MTLVKDVSEVDRYDRLLRYILVGDQFVNYVLVQEGYAESAKYPPDTSCANLFDTAESNADNINAGMWKPTSTPGVVVVPPSGGNTGNCDPSYPTVCIPPYPPDLDCGEISFRRFTVQGSDPHGFDGDNDGIGCESG